MSGLTLGCCTAQSRECPFEIKMLDGGSTNQFASCLQGSRYDCTAELTDGGATESWKLNCER
ncbi:MAG: hypothetical protein IPJ65_04990 [Archangiaceae bacterium]|nr:hypothetical protein [Archangiaceae bacterium]